MGQDRRNFIAYELELRLSCTKTSICWHEQIRYTGNPAKYGIKLVPNL